VRFQRHSFRAVFVATEGRVRYLLKNACIEACCYMTPQPLSSGVVLSPEMIASYTYMSHSGIRWLLALSDVPRVISLARVTQLSPLNDWTHEWMHGCSRFYGSCAIRNISHFFLCIDTPNWGIKYCELLSRVLSTPFLCSLRLAAKHKQIVFTDTSAHHMHFLYSLNKWEHKLSSVYASVI
jgi:hypothetical protein